MTKKIEGAQHVLDLPAGAEVTAMVAAAFPERGVWIAVREADGSAWVTFCSLKDAFLPSSHPGGS